jgi:hypothetical protein
MSWEKWRPTTGTRVLVMCYWEKLVSLKTIILGLSKAQHSIFEIFRCSYLRLEYSSQHQLHDSEQCVHFRKKALNDMKMMPDFSVQNAWRKQHDNPWGAISTALSDMLFEAIQQRTVERIETVDNKTPERIDNEEANLFTVFSGLDIGCLAKTSGTDYHWTGHGLFPSKLSCLVKLLSHDVSQFSLDTVIEKAIDELHNTVLVISPHTRLIGYRQFELSIKKSTLILCISNDSVHSHTALFKCAFEALLEAWRITGPRSTGVIFVDQDILCVDDRIPEKKEIIDIRNQLLKRTVLHSDMWSEEPFAPCGKSRVKPHDSLV